MRRERKSKSNILIYIVAALLCATLFSMHFVGGLYARYSTRSSGSDSARVAEFKITQEGTIFQEIKADVTPGTTQTVGLTVTNKSEVVVDYTLKVTNVTGNIPSLKFKLTPVGGAPQITTESYENGISINSVRRQPGSYTDNYTLAIVWDKSANDLAYIGMVDYITVSVTVTQVD